MVPTWKGQLTKTDIGKPRDFRHVGGFNLAERIRQFTQPSNTQEQQSRTQSQAQAEASADDHVYEEIAETPATPNNTPTTPVLLPPQPQRRTLPVPSSTPRNLPPPVMAKPKSRLSEPSSSFDVPPQPSRVRSEHIISVIQTEDESLTSFSDVVMAKIAMEKRAGENSSTEIQTGIVDLSLSHNSDECIYDDIYISNERVEIVDSSHDNTLDVTPEPLEEADEMLRVKPRHPVGRSPSTVAALSFLDSVIEDFSGCIDEEDDEEVEDVKTNVRILEEEEENRIDDVKKSDDNVEDTVSASSQTLAPPIPKPRTRLSTDIVNKTTDTMNVTKEEVMKEDVCEDSKQLVYDDVEDTFFYAEDNRVTRYEVSRDSIYDDVELKSSEVVDRPPELNGVEIACSAVETNTASRVEEPGSRASMAWEKDAFLSMDDIADPALRLLLHKAGVTNKDLQDQSTRDFIFQFILDHGGQEAVEKESHLLEKFKTVAARKKKKRMRVVEINLDCDDDVLGTDL